MKKIMLLMAVALVSTTACQKVKSIANINFSVPYTQTATLPSVPGYTFGMPLPKGGVALPFPAVTVATNEQQYFDKYHASSKNVISAELATMNMQIIAPPGQNFDFLDTLQFFVSTKEMPEVLVAFQYIVPKGQLQIDLNVVPNLDLRSYFLQDSMTVRLYAHINAVPASGTQIQSNGKFNIVANPF